MSDLSPEHVRAFVAGYTPADEPAIRFAWNGEHDDFHDANVEFRAAVLDAVTANLQSAPIELVRDLYRAETEWSTEAWSIDGRVGQLGEHLLRHGGDRFIEDYLEGRSRSFDAALGTSFVVDLPLAEHLLAVVRDRLRSATDADRAELLRFGEDTFGKWAADCRKG